MVDLAKETNAKIIDLQAKLKVEQERLRNIMWTKLPAMMKDMKLKSFKTLDGLDIDLKDEVQCSISEERRASAIGWLEANKHEGIIKREISIAFNKDQQEQADKLMAELAGRFAGLGEKKTVHPSTLKAFVKEMLTTGKSIPTDIFAIRQFEIAKIPNLKVAAD